MDAEREAAPDAVDAEGEQDVAALMGFSSFGRKRKHGDSPITARPAPGLQSTSEAPPPPAAPAFLPAKPPSRAKDESSAPAGGNRGSGQRVWWVGYYDPTSNENPWEVLEGRAGLGALGSWLPRGHAYGVREAKAWRSGTAGGAEAVGGAEAARAPEATEGGE